MEEWRPAAFGPPPAFLTRHCGLSKRMKQVSDRDCALLRGNLDLLMIQWPLNPAQVSKRIIAR